MSALHDRMPVILPPDHYASWLDRAQRDPAPLLALLGELAEPPLEQHPVGRRVNDPRHDAPDCLAPAGAEFDDPQPNLFAS